MAGDAALVAAWADRDGVAGGFQDCSKSVRIRDPAEVAGPAGDGVVYGEESAPAWAARARIVTSEHGDVFGFAAEVEAQSEQESALEASETFLNLEHGYRKQDAHGLGSDFMHENRVVPLRAPLAGTC